MVSNDVIRKILEAGIRAPSGENSQPWRFRIDGDRVWLFNRPEADQSLFNFHQNGSYVAHGTLLENVRIAAGALGYDAVIDLFPAQSKENLVATIDFRQGAQKAEPLFEAIERRVTNRKKYDASPLGDREKKELLACADSDVRLVLVEAREDIAKLARAASTGETMLVLNRRVHDFFFSHVRWTPEENRIQPNGFYIDTLELNAQQTKGFKVLRKWGAARILARLGVAKTVGKDNEETYETSSAMVGVVVKGGTPRNFVQAGQIFERAWLTATKLGLSVQPSTGALFLAEGMATENRGMFSEAERSSLENARRTIYETLGIRPGEGHVAVLFRVGWSDLPSAQAARFSLDMFLSESAMRGEQELPKLAASRGATIDHVLTDLATLKDNPSFANQYAVIELMDFFRAIRSLPKYLHWLRSKAPKLDRTRLLELTDLPFPRWDIEMHMKLIEIESRDFPGLIRPLVDGLAKLVSQKKEGTFIGVNLGSGGMEVDRQVLRKLIREPHRGKVVVIGVDKSPVTHGIAKDNLSEIRHAVAIHEVETLDRASLARLIASEKRQYMVILCKNDIFKLPEFFDPKQFDVAYHSLFKHHLTDTQKKDLDLVMEKIAENTLEYDGYRNWHVLLPQNIVAWQYPVFLNAGVFSEFRYLPKKELQAAHPGVTIPFYPNLGTYLLEKHPK